MTKTPNPANGSSPRVRGTAISAEAGTAHGRFIPACAGNSKAMTGSAPCKAVHPRVCGEQTEAADAAMPITGSSPRVRGTGQNDGKRAMHRRFIPACAGNSHRRRPRTGSGPVHPRVCGEQSPLSIMPAMNSGSSPRVRGTGSPRSGALTCRRFIPACAGNRPRPMPLVPGAPVHPRVCGEQGPQV